MCLTLELVTQGHFASTLCFVILLLIRSLERIITIEQIGVSHLKLNAIDTGFCHFFNHSKCSFYTTIVVRTYLTNQIHLIHYFFSTNLAGLPK